MPCSLVTRISSHRRHALPHGVPGSCCRASAIHAIAFKRGNHCQRNAGVTTVASINTSPGLISPRFSASIISKAPHGLLPIPPGYCLPVLTHFTAVIRRHSLQLHQRRIAFVCSNVLTISVHTWCCLMRRCASYQAYRLQNLAIKKPGSRKRLRAFNIHSTYQALCARAIPHRGFQYARRRYTAAHVADNV